MSAVGGCPYQALRNPPNILIGNEPNGPYSRILALLR